MKSEQKQNFLQTLFRISADSKMCLVNSVSSVEKTIIVHVCFLFSVESADGLASSVSF